VEPEPEPEPEPLDTSVYIEILPGSPLVLATAEEPKAFQAISGVVGRVIEPKDVIITFKEETLADDIETGTPVDWIINLPQGLGARIREAQKDTGRIVISVEGIPAVPLNENIHIFIPDSFLTHAMPQDILSEEAKFEILEGSLDVALHYDTPVIPPDYVYLNGSIGTEATPADLRVTLTGAALAKDIEEEIPVDWVRNLPAGLSASVQSAKAGTTTLVITLRGTPREVREDAVQVVIPAAILGSIEDFAVPNEIIVWHIKGAVVQTVLIDGSVDSAISAKDVTITLSGVSFAADLAPGTVVPWITNLPQGLTARVKQVRAGENRGIITVAGTPAEISEEVLSITIPAAAVSGVGPVPAVPNSNARFTINGNIRQISTSYINNGSQRADWMGSAMGPLNVPVLPSVKDFEGLGIVTVQATAVEQLGPDNQYHWSGKIVNYGSLIIEAQRLGADAIINVVIDYTDSIQNVQTTREIAQEHQWTEEEQDKLSKGILKEVRSGGIRRAVETNRVVTRTYTGSALAIKYKDGLDYYDAEQLRTKAAEAIRVADEATRSAAAAQEAAAQASQAATQAANQATQAAQSSAQAANQATQAAQSSAQAATQATQAAQSSAQSATQATQAAQTAAQSSARPQPAATPPAAPLD
jgi:hypothetical protein